MKKADKKVKEYLERATELIGVDKKLWTLALKDYKEVLVEIAKMIQKEQHLKKLTNIKAILKKSGIQLNI